MSVHVNPDIRMAEGLPASCFTDGAFLSRELATIFESSWLMVPDRAASDLRDDPRSLVDFVAPRGGRVAVSLLDRPMYLQRGWDDDHLCLLPNACTHAWFPLVTGSSRGNTVTCAQHGRKFDCRGRFISQPGFERADGFPRREDHLREMPVREWHRLMFTCFGEPALPFDELFAPIDESLARLPLDRLRRNASAASRRELEGNWKQHSWNFMDVFHVTWIHRAPNGLADRLDMSSYRTELHGRASLQWAYARDPAHGFDPAMLPDRFRDDTGAGRRVFALWWLVFPNLTLNFYPWGLSVNSYNPIPGRPDRTLFAWEHFVMDDALYARRDRDWLNAQVDAEDVDAMAQVRRGLRSGITPRPRFSPTHEVGPHWFHRLVAEGVGG